MRRLTKTLLLAVLALALAGCAEEREDDAVEATERNAFTLDGLRYRVALFRQINPRLAPDRALYARRPPKGRAELFAAFLEVCNGTDEPRRPAAWVQLEDAFGTAFPRVAIPPQNPLGYGREPLEPGRCLPAEDGTADRSLPGAAVLFEVPPAALGNRPFVLEMRDPGGSGDGVRRVQLDL